MRVRVRLFAMMAAGVGMREVEVEMRAGARVGELRGVLVERFEKLKWVEGTVMAVNQEYTGGERVLMEGDEVAVIPPVSGG